MHVSSEISRDAVLRTIITIMAPEVAYVDPFADDALFKYAPKSSVRAAYPLSPKSIVPNHIVRPNYARESVSATFWFWWEVRSPSEGGMRGPQNALLIYLFL